MKGDTRCCGRSTRRCALVFALSLSAACSSGSSNGSCSNTCAPEGSTACADGAIGACLPGADGCLAWTSPIPCPSSSCDTATTCGGCTNECSVGTIECVSGQLRTCEPGVDGCLRWSSTPCLPSGTCADSTHCASCVNECASGATRCQAGEYATCITGGAGCTVWSASVPCPDGSCATATSCTGCTPSCAGKTCGDDGCGGNACGTCTSPQICNSANQCVTPCTAGADECTDAGGYHVCGPDAGVNSYGWRIPCDAGNVCSGGLCSGHCTTPEVMLLLDRSSSMIGNRWNYLVSSTVLDFVWDEQGYVRFGLQMFPSSGACAVGSPVPMALDNYNAVESGLLAPSSDAQTPIAAALESLRTAYGDPNEAQYAILISDGGESCASSGDAAVTTAGELARQGVDTFVVAVSPDADVTLLDRIASAGRTGTSYRVGTDVELLAALYEIVGRTRACACGDGLRQSGEACDDGNRNDFDYCSGDCQWVTGRCGDGVFLDTMEACDDGNTRDGDYCSADCQHITGRCGDGIKQTNERCDDGNTRSGDYCSANCQTAYGSCGDGIVQSFEACDDGNTASGDYCAADCKSVTGSCGDGLVQTNEVCDDGNNTACGSCDATCTGVGMGSTCGDGIVCPDTEACDDGHTTECGACNATCTGPGTGFTCGDGIVCPDAESCDDGHTTACGPCNATCTGPGTGSTCGDGVVCPDTESCDDGHTTACGACDATCTGPGTGSVCGDSALCADTEVCDDGNTASGDYCASSCQSVTGRCGDGLVQTNEACDDGNTSPGDYCSADCKGVTGRCGDGIKQTNEACDDGNTASGDYCASDCKTVTGRCGDGLVQTNEACDDGNTASGDYCAADCSGVTGRCGDGLVQTNEVCDDGRNTACGPCDATCTGAGIGSTCGDGMVCPDTEACDDGFTTACGACNETCTGPGTGFTCGDGIVCPDAESCDDGHTTACGPCNATCTGPGTGSTCGDGVVCPDTESCDDGHTTGCGPCNATCTGAGTGSVCGDSVICEDTEICDDGNTEAGDYCAASCDAVTGRCGDSIVQTNEACDDGNTTYGDYCSADCTSVTGRCGDGVRQTNEVCDLPIPQLCTSCAAHPAVFGGGYFTCAVRSSGVAKCWGSSYYGQLGQGDTTNRGDGQGEMGTSLPAVDLGTSRTVLTMAAGEGHACALLDDGSVKCWGANSYGQLGVGDTANRGDGPGELGDLLPAVSVAMGHTSTGIGAGWGHTCALLDNGGVKCWGYNATGQLGLGDTVNRGDGVLGMGDSLPAVSLGTGRSAVAIGIGRGSRHTCALLDDGSLKCWGSNSYGQLGLGDMANRGDGPGEMGDNLPAVSLGTGLRPMAVALGLGHTCALMDDGSVKCWGYNYGGALGLGDVNNRGDERREMGDFLPTVSLGTGRRAVAIGAGLFHTCALLDDASVKCWGYNVDGQLGLGDVNNRGDAPGEMGDNLPAVNLGTGRTAVAISVGDSHTCALLDDGSVKCWGFNFYGQLGIGNTADRGDAPNEMGDNLPALDIWGP